MRSTVRSSLAVLVILTMLVPGLVACGPTSAPPAGGTTPGTTPEAVATAIPATTSEPAVVRIGWGGSPDTLNPGTAVLAEAYTLFELVYDSMYQLQLDGSSYSLELADSVQVSDDSKVWTFHVRPGIKFHDGEALTADDIAFSYNYYQDHQDFPYLSVYTQYFEQVAAPDESTVVISLTQAIPNMESQLIYLYVLPEHIWSQYTDPTAAIEFENEAMIGSGPFKMVEYRQNEFVRLAANKEHYLNSPKVDEVVFQTFENQDALVQALRTGQVDMITEMPKTAVPSLRNAENVKLVTGAPLSPSIRDIIFNQTAPENCPPDGVCSGHPALRDRNVRLALAHATDKKKIIDVALLGLGTPGLTLVANGLGMWYNNSLQDYAFDIVEANRILDQAGYADTDGDGVRQMPDGSNPLNLRLYWPSDIEAAPRIAEMLSETWGQVGVKVQAQAFDPDALTAACCPAFDFDVMIWGWGSDPDPGFLLGVLTTEQIPTGSSETGYSNPEYDKLFVQQGTELDKEKRREIVWEMQKILFDDVVYIIPYYEDAAEAYRTDRFTGWITDAPKVALEDPTSLTVIEPVK
jgi:peptide/nickel transport system substrate-binding protein